MSEPKGQHNEQATHPAPDALAEFRAGLVTGRAGARISAHLAGCDQCALLCGELAEVSALLAAVPAPALPGQVAQRLDRVLAAEAARRDDPRRAVADLPAGSPSRGRRDFRRPAWRIAAPVAAAVVALAAGGYGLSHAGGGPANSTASGTAGGAAVRQQSGALPAASAGRRAAAVPAIRAPASFPVVTSQTDYQRATLRQQAEHELQLDARGAAGPRAAASEAVRGCVSMVTAGVSPGTVVLAETASFQGRPAVVIVAVSGPGDVAWVTSPACSAGSGDVLAETTLPGTTAP